MIYPRAYGIKRFDRYHQIDPKVLPKQADIDKILDTIKRKFLKGTHLPLTIKEIQAGYLTSPYFKDHTFIWLRINYPTKKCYTQGRKSS